MSWPPLPLEQWQPTRDTMHLWTQIVGKTRLGLEPRSNHWWNSTLYVTARGLTTSLMPYTGGADLATARCVNLSCSRPGGRPGSR
jgi:hypothetical protein